MKRISSVALALGLMAVPAYGSDAALNWGDIDHSISDDGRSITLTHNHKDGDKWQLVGPSPFTYKAYSDKNPVTVSCPGDGGDIEVQRSNDMHWIKVFNTNTGGAWSQVAELDFYLTCEPAPEPPVVDPPPPPTIDPPGPGEPPVVTPPPAERLVQIGKVGPKTSAVGTLQRYRLVAINRGNVDQKVFIQDKIPLGAYPHRTGKMPNGLKISRNGIVTYRATLKPGQRIIRQFYVKFAAPSHTRCAFVNNAFSVRGKGIGTTFTGFVKTRVCGTVKPPPAVTG